MAAGPVVTLFLLCFAHIGPAFAIYEDQIGKFDWAQRYVGVVTKAVFDESTVPRRIIVATAENVLAALATKNGDIVWRHVLELGEGGLVEALVGEGQRVTTVAGRLVRTWDTLTAALVQETYLSHTPQPGTLHRAVVVDDSEVVIGEVVPGSVVVTLLDRVSGVALDHTTVAAPWLTQDTRCESGGKSVVCVELSLGLIFVLPLTAPSPAFASQPLASVGLEGMVESDSQVLLQIVPGAPEHFIIQVGSGRRLVHLHGDSLHMVRDLGGSRTSAVAGGVLYTLTQVGQVVTLGAVDLESGNELGEQGLVVELPSHSGAATALHVHHYQTSDRGSALRALLTCADHSLHLFSSAGVVWWREESLARVVAVEGVDLPVDGANINFQDPLPSSPDWVSSLVHRVRSQVSQVSHWLSVVVERSDAYPAPLHALHRDALNLRKLLVLITASGKIVGVDSWNGEVVWRLFVGDLEALEGDRMILYTQRTSAHFPHQPQCVVVGRHRRTGLGMAVAFNPITGEAVGEAKGVTAFGYPIIQALLLHHPDPQYLKPVVVFDSELRPHVFPASGESTVLEHKDSIFINLARPGSTHLTGYTLKFSEPGNLVLREVWRVEVGGGGGVITGVHGKLAWEKVHSPGRVLADRSVLYKYVNPNLAVVITQGYDHLNKNTLTLYLVDTVCGAVIEAVNHKKVSGPIHVVHSENWVVYTFFNDKYRRFEVTSLELFEGLNQANATAFSSLGGRATPPILERQTYILPVGVQAAAHTTTEKGITTKFILFALQTGNVMQMSKWLLDPRRPVSPIQREEGLVPYIPELRLSPNDMINYNNTLLRVAGIFTSPTGLESACVVVVYGLDLFYTRMFPSKMFDVLKDDFDHYLIGGALLALMAAALITRKLSQRKALKQAWK